jgi:hypothetical protein
LKQFYHLILIFNRDQKSYVPKITIQKSEKKVTSHFFKNGDYLGLAKVVKLVGLVLIAGSFPLAFVHSGVFVMETIRLFIENFNNL